MPTVSQFATTAAVAAALVASCVLASPANATTATPVPSPSVTASRPDAASPTASPAPTAAPAPTSTPSPSVPASPAPTATPAPAVGDDPSLATMNAARNHAMGSTIPVEASEGSGSKFRSLAAARPAGVQGLDVSGWQVLNLANWRTIYANGGRFAYVKATESTDYRSSQFAEQYSDSYTAGLAHGAYHFATPNTSSGATQANFFVNNGGGWTNDGRTLPPLLDIEYNPYGATCYGLSAAQMVSWIRDFSNTILARTGRLPAIYSTTDWWTRCTGNTSSFGANPLFIARYPSNIASGAGTLPAGWSRYTMWQYADAGVFPGDQDVFNGTEAQLAAFARGTSTGGGGATPIPPAPTPLTAPVIGTGDLNGDGKPDFIARRPDGTLWFYAGTGTVSSTDSGYAAAVQIGVGWNAFDTILGVGDFTGDGKPDLVARKTDGTLWLYASNNAAKSKPTFASGRQIGTGWSVYTEISAAGDFDGDGKADLLARRPDGTLWFYAGTGVVGGNAQGYAAGKKIGTGWNVFKQVLGVGDLNRDGKADLIGLMPNGSAYYYAGTRRTSGTNAWYLPARPVTLSGVTGTSTLVAPGDLNRDGTPDLLARSAAGALTYLPGSVVKDEGYSAAKTSAGGWNVNTNELGVGDFTGDGKADVLATRADGSLWLYPGLGSMTSTGALYVTPSRIGTSWQVYSKLVAPGDFNGDGKPDLLGIRADGTFWFYAGTGKVAGADTGYKPGVKVGHGWGVYDTVVGVGDFNADGRSDLIARRPDGSLWFYAGTAVVDSTHEGYKPAVKLATNWQIFDTILGVGDVNSDGRPDIVARRTDGTLSFFAGTGKPSATNSGFAPEVQIGHGWNTFQTLVGGQDANGDRINDIIGIRADGSALFYAGTGTAGSTTGSFSSTMAIGTGWQIYG